MLLSWNQVYDFRLQQLRLRVTAKEGNEFSGKCDIEDNRILKDFILRKQSPDISIWD
jgi:hypothetical protein